MQQTRCTNCMKEIAPDMRYCPYCGYDQQAECQPSFLRQNTILRGRYLVGRVIGKGGFGITYVGFDLTLEMKVAIKEYYPSGIATRNNSWSNQVLWESIGQDARAQRADSMERVLKEARRTAKLANVPTVVRVIDAFCENETAYIVMDFIEGTTLKDYLKQHGVMTFEECEMLLFPVMEGLAAAHDIGIIHRDISPDNIMVQPDGTAKLLDLGAAVDVSLNDGHASTLVVKNHFSALEQYDENGHLGSWTDVYAFAAMLYYCMTGKLVPPVMDRLASPQDLAFPAQPEVPAYVKEVLTKALAIRQEDRIQDMRTLEKALTQGKAEEVYAKETGKEQEQMQVQDQMQKKVPNSSQAQTQNMDQSLNQNMDLKQDLKQDQNQFQSQSPKPQPKRSSSKMPKLLLPFAAIFCVAIVFGIIMLVSTGKTTNNIMMSDSWIEGDFESTEYEYVNSVLGSNYERSEIIEITFLDSLENEPADSWDVSEMGDGSVKAWVSETDKADEYDLYIAANGGVTAPTDCSFLFGGYHELVSIDFGESFDTSQVTSMLGMFAICANLTELDVSGFDTSQVTNMSCMFYICMELTELDVSGFDTSQVTNMSCMFYICEKLTKLDISSFDTSQVTDMSNMFLLCASLTELDVSGFDTSQVTDMSSMFKECSSLTSLTLWSDVSDSDRDTFYESTVSAYLTD